MRGAKVAILIVCALSTEACSSSDQHQLAPPLSSVLTGAASVALNSNGRFELAGSPTGEIDEGKARKLAVAYAVTAGQWMLEAWQEDRGATISLNHLAACERAYYARSAFAPIPSASTRLRQRFGGYWLVGLCEDGVQVVSVAIPGLATELRADAPNAIRGLASQILSFGIPVRLGKLPVEPEPSATQVGELTESRIIQVPELVLPPPPHVPQLAKWRFVLETPTRLRSTGASEAVETRVVYFGVGETWHTLGLLRGRSASAPIRAKDQGRGGTEVALVAMDGYANAFEAALVEGR
jgi:hypothetical protein